MPPPLPRPQTALFLSRFAAFVAGRLQGQKPHPLLKELPVAVTNDLYPQLVGFCKWEQMLQLMRG